jgi:formylglycine-generating enzyme required for sulfatase activity
MLLFFFTRSVRCCPLLRSAALAAAKGLLWGAVLAFLFEWVSLTAIQALAAGPGSAITPPITRSSSILSEFPECPLLPGCPGGFPVPLPPVIERQPEIKAPAPVVNGNGLTEGTDKYLGMIFIPAGRFDMGSPAGQGRVDERPIHAVFLKDFYIAKQEVTAREFSEFLNQEGIKTRDGRTLRVRIDDPACPVERQGNMYVAKAGFEDHPMVCVSWQGAVDYAEWKGCRLPTSAEWEKAALLTTPMRPEDALTVSAEEGTVPVSMAPVGVRDVRLMVGNVWQWCSDWYERDFYEKMPSTNPTGPALGQEKIIRGGSWASAEASRRIQNLHKAAPQGFYRTLGFRVVKD